MRVPVPDKGKAYHRFAALVAEAVKRAEATGYFVVGDDAPRRGLVAHARSLGRCLCPNGAVVLLAERRRLMRRSRAKFEQQYPICDVSSEAYRLLLGGKVGDWIDQARAFEVGFDGDDPSEECVSKRDPYYLLGVKYREEHAS